MNKVIFKDGRSEKCPICKGILLFVEGVAKCSKCNNTFEVANYDKDLSSYKVKDCSPKISKKPMNRI